MPSASPLALIEATVVFDELQVTRLLISLVVPSLKVPEAAYCCVCPISSVEFGGVSVIDVSPGRRASAHPVSAPRAARTAASKSFFAADASCGRQSRRVNFAFRSISLLVITSFSFLLCCNRPTPTEAVGGPCNYCLLVIQLSLRPLTQNGPIDHYKTFFERFLVNSK